MDCATISRIMAKRILRRVCTVPSIIFLLHRLNNTEACCFITIIFFYFYTQLLYFYFLFFFPDRFSYGCTTPIVYNNNGSERSTRKALVLYPPQSAHRHVVAGARPKLHQSPRWVSWWLDRYHRYHRLLLPSVPNSESSLLSISFDSLHIALMIVIAFSVFLYPSSPYH